MAEWTRVCIEERLEGAVDLMRAMPDVKPNAVFRLGRDTCTASPRRWASSEMKRPTPSPRAITEAEEAMLWLPAPRAIDRRRWWSL